MAFLSREQLNQIGFGSVGENVEISDKCSIYSPKNIFLKSNIRIDDFSILSAGEGGIFIGNNVHIACFVSLIGKGKITLSDFCGLSGRCSIYSSNDDYSGNFLTGPTVSDEFKNVQHAPVYIGKHVIVGVGSCILPGVSIGEGAAVGAFSLVIKDVEESIIVTGVPATFRKPRSRKVFELEKEFITEND